MAEAAFEPFPPPLAQDSLGPEDFLARAAALRRSFLHDGEARAAFRAVIESLGLDPAATFADRLILRLQPSGAAHSGRRVRDLPPHRDTWGSNLMAQINLWGPVFPLDSGATMVIWPALFDRAAPNTSAEWDLDRLREAPGRYPLLPVLRGPLPGEAGAGAGAAGIEAAEVPVLIRPGDLLCFSGAHLHASRPNRTGAGAGERRTRVSWEANPTCGRGGERRTWTGAPRASGANGSTGSRTAPPSRTHA